MLGITLSVKMVRNKEEDREGIFQTYFWCGVNCGLKNCCPVMKARGCLSFSSWAPQLVNPTCYPALRRQRPGSKYPSLVVCPAAHQLRMPMLLQREIKAAPSCGMWSCVPSGPLSRGAQHCTDFVGPNHQHWETEHKANHREQVRQLLTPDSYSCLENKVLHVPFICTVLRHLWSGTI